VADRHAVLVRREQKLQAINPWSGTRDPRIARHPMTKTVSVDKTVPYFDLRNARVRIVNVFLTRLPDVKGVYYHDHRPAPGIYR
jgi:hypothetical protein